MTKTEVFFLRLQLMNHKFPDFKMIDQSVSIQQVVEELRLDLPPYKKTALKGNCPLKNHEGDRNSKGFNVDTEKDIFHCFTCGRKGYGSLNFYHAVIRGETSHRELVFSAREMMKIFFGKNEIPPLLELTKKHKISSEKEALQTNEIKKIFLKTNPDIPLLKERKNIKKGKFKLNSKKVSVSIGILF